MNKQVARINYNQKKLHKFVGVWNIHQNCMIHVWYIITKKSIIKGT